MKGLFIPDITAEMFRNGCLESIEALMAEGEIYDIEYDLKSAEPDSKELSFTHKALDTISRQAAIDAVNSETVSTNPEHFKGHEKFIAFMEDEDISSFGKWERANGFNTALVATRIHLKKLPSAQPEIKPIDYRDCANAMMMMWIDKVLTDGEYNRIMDKMNAHELKKRAKNG